MHSKKSTTVELPGHANHPEHGKEATPLAARFGSAAVLRVLPLRALASLSRAMLKKALQLDEFRLCPLPLRRVVPVGALICDTTLDMNSY